jgi:metal-dependent HD superfamily phosphatase/phosphodiesterase
MARLTRPELAQKTINDTYRLLRQEGFHTANLVFEALIKDLAIDAHYAKSEQASERWFINRHDKTHAIRTTYNAMMLFAGLVNELSLLRRGKDQETGQDLFGFDIIRDCHIFGIDNVTANDFTGACLVVASFCHDMYKFLREAHDAIAVLMVGNIVRRTLEPMLHVSLADVGLDMFMPTIESAVFRHGGNENALSAEEGIIMISDVMDNDELRVLDIDLAKVIKYDKDPMQYISCIGIRHPVQIQRPGEQKLLEVVFRLKTDAGWLHVIEMRETLLKSGLGNLISLRAYTPKGKSLLLH